MAELVGKIEGSGGISAKVESRELAIRVEIVGSGPQGKTGYTPKKGVDYFTEQEAEAFKEAATPVKGEDYFTAAEVAAFKEAVTPQKGVDYFDGENGPQGKPGYTPVKGVDYFTEAEAEAFKEAATPVKGKDYFTAAEAADFKEAATPKKGVDYFDGKDGHTPVKGTDYFTDAEAEAFKKAATPVKGIDYRDGVDGKDGQNGTDGKDGANGKDGTNGKDGVDGKDGKTPEKGVDYFTPSEVAEFKKSVTPVKGTDYFDGQDGEPGHTPEAGVDYYTAEERSEFISDVLNQFPGQSISNANRATNDANGRMIAPVYNQFYNNLGTPSLFELATLFQEFGCKTDFAARSRVLYETSKDLGKTWEELAVSDEVHETLWGGTYLGGLTVNKLVDPDDETSDPLYFRFTLTAQSYCFLNLLYMYTSGNGGQFHIKYEKRKTTTQEWVTQYETPSGSFVNLGWPGHSIIYHGNIPFSTGQGSTYFDRVRVTIYHTPTYKSNLTKYKTFMLYKVKFLGGYPMQEDFQGIKINGHNKAYEFPAGIKLGNTSLTEDQLKKLLALI